jgi:hypothetical protein
MGGGDDDILSLFLSACNISFCSPLPCQAAQSITAQSYNVITIIRNVNRMVRRLAVKRGKCWKGKCHRSRETKKRLIMGLFP